MWISKSKLKDIERQLENLYERLWLLENPQKFKRGDKVRVSGPTFFGEGVVLSANMSVGLESFDMMSPKMYWNYDVMDAGYYVKSIKEPYLSPLQAETPESDTNVPKSGESA